MAIYLILSTKLSTPNDGEILIDYSKNRVDEQTLKLLVDLVHFLPTNTIIFFIFFNFKLNQGYYKVIVSSFLSKVS